MSIECKSLFETYTVKFFNLKERSNTVQHLDKAVERSYGLQFNLKLTIYHVLHDISMDEVLSKYKEMITFLEIPLRPNDPKYLMPSCDLKNLNELVVNSHGDTEVGHKVMVEEMLSKYGEQLEHFGLTSFKYFEGYVMVPILPRLKSLDLDNIDINTVRSLVSKVSKQSILKLTLKSIPSFAADEIDEFVMPNINKIKLRLERPFSWALIKLNKETLVEIDVRKIWADSPIGEVEQINLPKLKILRICGFDKAASKSLIKGGAQTLEKLYLYRTKFGDDFNEISFPNLKYLYINDVDTAAAISLIRGAQTLETLHLQHIRYVFEEIDFNDILFPNLKYLYIDHVDKAAAISLIKGGAQTLETLHLQHIRYVFEEIDFNDILFPNLKYLYLPGEAGNEIIRRAQDTLIELTVGRPWVTSDTRENNPIRFSKLKTLSIEKLEDLLLLIGSASKSVTTLIIKGCCKTNQKDLKYLQIPNLKTLVTEGTTKTVILDFIKLGMNTITKLIIDGKVISSEKLNKLKHILKIVKNVTAGELDSILNS